MTTGKSNGRVIVLGACALMAAFGSILATVGPAGAKPKDARRPIVFRPTPMSPDDAAAEADFDLPQFPSPPLTGEDGVFLYVRIYRPYNTALADSSFKTPVIVVHNPYANAAIPADPLGPVLAPAPKFEPLFVSRSTRRGYTVLLSDVRGTGYSGGCFDSDGKKQATDLRRIINYAADEPWSTGRVGAFGFSYPAEAIKAAAVLDPPPKLETMVIGGGISGMYDDHYYDGVPYGPTSSADGKSNALSYASISFGPPSDPTRWDPLTERPHCQPESLGAQFDVSGDMTPWFKERDFRAGVDNVRASVLEVQSLSDYLVYPVNLDGWHKDGTAGWFDSLPTVHKGVVWQSNSGDPHGFPCSDDEPECRASADAARADFYQMVDAWFDRWLKDLPTGAEDWPAVQVQDQYNQWRVAPSFAGLGKPQRLPLGEGVIGTQGAMGKAVTFHETGEANWEMPVTEWLHISGTVEINARITLDRDDAHFVAYLQYFGPGESPPPVASGLKCSTIGYLSARHRTSLEQVDGLPPSQVAVPIGVPFDYSIRLMPFDQWLEPGSTLRLVMSGVDPRKESGLGNCFPGGVSAGSGFTASVSVNGASSIRLPIVRKHVCLDILQVQPPRMGGPGVCGEPAPSRIESRRYVASSVLSIGPNCDFGGQVIGDPNQIDTGIGGVCFPIVEGETSVSFQIDDADSPFSVGGEAYFLRPDGTFVPDYFISFCDHGTMLIPRGVATLVIHTEVFLGCANTSIGGTTGTITAKFW